MHVWFYTLLSVLLVSLVSLIGVATLLVGSKKLQNILVFLVSFSAGTLLGDAFIHLIPEAFENKGSLVGIYILLGMLIFFLLEKVIHWRHCHEQHCEHHEKVLPYVILMGDALHNFIDGIIIAASFLVSVPVGIATTVAVVIHEIPQEIGDFAALLYGGFGKAKALMFNFISALAAVLGAVLVLLLSANFENLVSSLIPVAAGGFIYIALADMIPEMHKHTIGRLKHSLIQFVFLFGGIGIMYLLLFIE